MQGASIFTVQMDKMTVKMAILLKKAPQEWETH